MDLNKHGYKQCPICHEALKEYKHNGTDIWQCTMCVFAGCNVFTQEDLFNFEEKLQTLEFGIKIRNLNEKCPDCGSPIDTKYNCCTNKDCDYFQ